jgi:hypothetical protein
MPLPLQVDEKTYFFRNPDGGPITTQWWPKKSWYPVLHALGIRPRKFYATRHTFISVAVSKGCNLKWVAEYCGTSVEMIEKSYGKYIADDGADPLLRSLGGAKGQTLSQTFAEKTGTDENPPVISAVDEVVPRGIEPPATLRRRIARTPRNVQCFGYFPRFEHHTAPRQKAAGIGRRRGENRDRHGARVDRHCRYHGGGLAWSIFRHRRDVSTRYSNAV